MPPCQKCWGMIFPRKFPDILQYLLLGWWDHAKEHLAELSVLVLKHEEKQPENKKMSSILWHSEAKNEYDVVISVKIHHVIVRVIASFSLDNGLQWRVQSIFSQTAQRNTTSHPDEFTLAHEWSVIGQEIVILCLLLRTAAARAKLNKIVAADSSAEVVEYTPWI